MELCMNDLIGLFRLASLGKVTGGLIHNINGPLQNIGLDLEMSQYIIKKAAETNGDKEKNISDRLKRIEDELERLNTMIRISSNKATQSEDGLRNFNDYLEQELSFLNTNLFFKHNVETTLQLDESPPVTTCFPENSLLAIGWLLQGIVEDIDKTKTNTLTINTKKENSDFRILISTEKSNITKTIDDILKNTDIDSNKLIASDNESGLMLILKIFHMQGISVKAGTSQPATLAISIPLSD